MLEKQALYCLSHTFVFKIEEKCNVLNLEEWWLKISCSRLGIEVNFSAVTSSRY
jgi:hypothetical protein